MEELHPLVDAERPEASNTLEYPAGYFDAQVRFAQRWSQLGLLGISEALLEKTALKRRIIGDGGEDGQVAWQNLLADLDLEAPADQLTTEFYQRYAQNPTSHYDMAKIRHSFGFHYDHGLRRIKIHFTNPIRGEHPFSAQNAALRREEFQQMLKSIKDACPDARTLMSASWLRSTKSYQSYSPPNRNPEKTLMAPDMPFGGNSVWGQFIDYRGNSNRRTYREFIGRISNAKDPIELIEAFPYPTMMAEDPIDDYYTFYGVN